jgi:hypothetical protein
MPNLDINLQALKALSILITSILFINTYKYP